MRRNDRSPTLPTGGAFLLDRFVLESPLGEGAFAVVWRAADMGTGQSVVAKIAHAHHCGDDTIETLRSRFRAEYDAVSRVDHPNVVKMLAIGETEDGRPALVMEYAVGQSLGRILAHRAPLPMKFLAPVIKQVASALEAAHAVDVIHRDVSPDNVLVAPHRQSVRVSLVDFGVARLDGEGQHTVGPIGTPGYMAPEQILGNPLPASDLFSLGALLWWALTGREWLGDVPGPVHAALLRQVEMTEAPDARRLQPELSAPLSELVGALLHPRAEQRPTATAFLERWRQLTETRQSVAPPRGRNLLLQTSPGVTPSTTPPRRAEPLRRPGSGAVATWQRSNTRHDVPSTRDPDPSDDVESTWTRATRVDVPVPGHRGRDNGSSWPALVEVIGQRLAEALDPGRPRALRMASLREIATRARRLGAPELALAATSTANVLPRLAPEELAAHVAEIERQFDELRAARTA